MQQLVLSVALFVPLLLAALALRSIAASYSESVRHLATQNQAISEVVEEMGEEWATEPVEAGLYHPTKEATDDSLARRAEAQHREQFDPTEGWNDQSIFDLAVEEGFPAGRYPSGE